MSDESIKRMARCQCGAAVEVTGRNTFKLHTYTPRNVISWGIPKPRKCPGSATPVPSGSVAEWLRLSVESAKREAAAARRSADHSRAEADRAMRDAVRSDAKAAGLRIIGMINTHFHADFLSGHLELADATGVSLHAAVDDSKQDISNALLALGYNEKEAASAMKQLPADIGTADGIRAALKLLSKA